MLGGAWEHENGEVRDVRAWGGRGWCRLEQLANALSPRTKPLIVALSATAIATYGPGGIFGRPWLYEPIGRGNFTVDSDREVLAAPVAAMIDARKALALADGDLLWYRVLRACKAHLLDGLQGEPPPQHGLAEWMAQMRFASARDGAKSGLTPLRFAVLAGRPDLASQLLAQGADVEACLSSSHAPFEFLKGQSVLQAACTIRDDPALLQLLIDGGAQTRTTKTDPKLYALHFATMHGHTRSIDALMAQPCSAAQASLQSMCGSCPLRGDVPFAFATYFGRRATLDHLVRTYPDEMRELASRTNAAGHTLLSNNLLAVGDTSTLKATLELGSDAYAGLVGCDVNHAAGKGARKARRWLFWVFGPLDVARLLWTTARTGAGTEAWVHTARCSPLHAAAYLGNMGAVNVLLDFGADARSTSHPRGCTPLHCAALGGHASIVRKLIDAGADEAAKDGRGRTAARYASRAGHAECAQLLGGSHRGHRI